MKAGGKQRHVATESDQVSNLHNTQDSADSGYQSGGPTELSHDLIDPLFSDRAAHDFDINIFASPPTQYPAGVFLRPENSFGAPELFSSDLGAFHHAVRLKNLYMSEMI